MFQRCPFIGQLILKTRTITDGIHPQSGKEP